MRSFSNLWYWIALAVLWSSASHWVIGVPFDMVMRARRKGGQAVEDLDMMVAINVSRLLYIAETAGVWLIGMSAFLLSTLAVLAFWYQVEFAQAVIFLLAPMTLVLPAVPAHRAAHRGRRHRRPGAVAPPVAAPHGRAGHRHGVDLRDLAVRHVAEHAHRRLRLSHGRRPHPSGRRARGLRRPALGARTGQGRAPSSMSRATTSGWRRCAPRWRSLRLLRWC